MKEKFLRGVNLGGWLVLEKWMTPTLFKGTEAIDEYTFMQTSGASEKIDAHRKTYITEEDFQWLSEHRVNAVRIPVGYWLLEGDGPYESAVNYLDWAMDMADEYELKVLIDVHGLPGSQNGHDHSGQVGKARWFRSPKYRQQSIDAVANIAKRYKERASLWGIQVINEPKVGLFHFKLRRYYRRVYNTLTQVLHPTTAIVISDGFTPRLLSGATKATTHPVVLDVHLYHMATPLAPYLSVDWFLKKTKRREKMLKRLSRKQPVIIGEWSGVMSHKTMRHIPKERHEELFVKYVQLQQEVYSATAGWFYWSYKTEKSGQWSFRSQVEAGLIDVT